MKFQIILRVDSPPNHITPDVLRHRRQKNSPCQIPLLRRRSHIGSERNKLKTHIKKNSHCLLRNQRVDFRLHVHIPHKRYRLSKLSSRHSRNTCRHIEAQRNDVSLQRFRVHSNGVTLVPSTRVRIHVVIGRAVRIRRVRHLHRQNCQSIRRHILPHLILLQSHSHLVHLHQSSQLLLLSLGNPQLRLQPPHNCLGGRVSVLCGCFFLRRNLEKKL